MSRFGKLAVTTVAATLVLIAFGGFVRAMEAGLGCPDWPTCHGSLNPPSSLGYGALKLAWIEHSHRLWAAVLIVLIVVLAIAAHRTRQPRNVRVATLWLVPVVLSQAVLGAVVVWLKLDAASVLLHLSGALTVLALAIYVALQSAAPAVVRPRLGALPVVTLAVTFGQMLLGSAVTGWGAGLAYGTFPSFDGAVVPTSYENVQQVLHVGHRMVAYVVVGLVVALWLRARQSEPLVARYATVALGLVLVQVVLGALNIWFELEAWSVAPHLAVGSWIVGALLVVVFRSSGRTAAESESGIAWRAVAA